MTDSQIATLAFAVIFPLSMLLYSNSRVTEAKETLRAEIGALRSDFRADLAQLTQHMEMRFSSMEARFNSIDRKLDELLRIVGDHETRISTLEQRPR